MVSRDYLKRMIDDVPEAALPSIEKELVRWTPHRAEAGERLIELLKVGYKLGLDGRRPYDKRDDLYDR